MSKLHFYRTVGGTTTKFADGDGKLSSTEEFDATITDGSVKKATVYEIRKGSSTTGEQYNCLKGAQKGETASFQKCATGDLVGDERFLGAALAVRQMLMASQKSVTIEIATEDLQQLKASDYKLCFAKKVGGEAFNVVWQSYTKYLVTNTFSWTPQYQMFGSNVFLENVDVKVSTNLVSIGLGETATLDSAGVLGQASTGGPDISMTMVNDYGSIHPGINQLSTGIDGSQVATPIYVAPQAAVKGNIEMTPVETILVWFEQNIETSTMFSTARAKSVEIDLTFSNHETRLYKDQVWSTP